MSWTDAFNFAKKGVAKHGDAPTALTERVDAGLPLGARIGAMLTMQMSPLIRANANGSLVAMPATADALIKAVGRVRLNLEGNLHRFYLDLEDQDCEQERFLQVYTNAPGTVAEILYCTRLTRIIPETKEEQDAFTGEGGVGLGVKTYTLWKTQLEELGLSASALQLVFGDTDHIEYTRDTGGLDDFKPPYVGSETRVDDTNGEHGLKQKIYFMPYVRGIGGGLEYLLITTEIVESQDGDTSRRSIHVDFMIGIPMELERVTVQ